MGPEIASEYSIKRFRFDRYLTPEPVCIIVVFGLRTFIAPDSYREAALFASEFDHFRHDRGSSPCIIRFCRCARFPAP